MRQHRAMTAKYFLPNAANETDLSAWLPLFPAPARVLRTNLFGDAFVLTEDGAIHMLERAACAAQCVTSSEEEFWRELEGDRQGWLLRRLADACRNEGKELGDGQCYAFSTLPVLGGDYVAENVWVAHWNEWFAFTADVFRQIKDLPDGARVTLKITK